MANKHNLNLILSKLKLSLLQNIIQDVYQCYFFFSFQNLLAILILCMVLLKFLKNPWLYVCWISETECLKWAATFDLLLKQDGNVFGQWTTFEQPIYPVNRSCPLDRRFTHWITLSTALNNQVQILLCLVLI